MSEHPIPPSFTAFDGDYNTTIQTGPQIANDGQTMYGAASHTHEVPLNIPGHTHSYTRVWEPPTITYSEDMELVFRRLGVLNHTEQGNLFDMICVHRHKGNAWCVVALPNKTPVVLETDHDLFPSDQLITQLRLLIEGKDIG